MAPGLLSVRAPVWWLCFLAKLVYSKLVQPVFHYGIKAVASPGGLMWGCFTCMKQQKCGRTASGCAGQSLGAQKQLVGKLRPPSWSVWLCSVKQCGCCSVHLKCVKHGSWQTLVLYLLFLWCRRLRYVSSFCTVSECMPFFLKCTAYKVVAVLAPAVRTCAVESGEILFPFVCAVIAQGCCWLPLLCPYYVWWFACSIHTSSSWLFMCLRSVSNCRYGPEIIYTVVPVVTTSLLV